MALAAPIPRVEALGKIHGLDLSPDQHRKLIAQAPLLFNSYEIAQYIRIASESNNAEWLPVLQDWVRKWEVPQQRWQGFMASSAKDAAEKLECLKALQK
jgi:hypothetical protein